MIFSPNLFVILKIFPHNIICMRAIKFFECLDFERKYSFCKRLNTFLYFIEIMLHQLHKVPTS
jgi:hypothetical protein